jgi:hypothetical protein
MILLSFELFIYFFVSSLKVSRAAFVTEVPYKASILAWLDFMKSSSVWLVLPWLYIRSWMLASRALSRSFWSLSRSFWSLSRSFWSLSRSFWSLSRSSWALMNFSCDSASSLIVFARLWTVIYSGSFSIYLL